MYNFKHFRWVMLPALAVVPFLACGGGDGNAPRAPEPTATPTVAPSAVTRIVVPVTDPETGETVEMGVDFDEGAGTGDDPTAEGKRGQTLIRVGRDAAVIFPIDDDGGLSPSIGLDGVECERSYLISRYIDAPTGVAGCAPPAAMAAQFNRTKDDALARAVEVVKECWKHPSCQARIEFQGSMRHCYRTPEGVWYLYTCYEVRVICFTL